MRSAMLLLATVFLFACHNTQKFPEYKKSLSNPLNDLAKYSYFVMTISKDTDVSGQKFEYGSTGFFIRDKDKRLFLITASHVMTQCDLLAYQRMPGILDKMKVWYFNRDSIYTFQEFSLANYEKKPCDSTMPRPDIDTMEVTGRFPDATIFSVEQLAPHYSTDTNELSTGDAVICFGYPKSTTDGKTFEKGMDRIIPKFDTSTIVDLPQNIRCYQSYYTAIHPFLPVGYSGAPVFRFNKKTMHIEYAGLQAFAAKDTSCSLIVQGGWLRSMLHWK